MGRLVDYQLEIKIPCFSVGVKFQPKPIAILLDGHGEMATPKFGSKIHRGPAQGLLDLLDLHYIYLFGIK